MKKKFVRVMLLGVLTLTTTTSFVGCKDYDSDISGLQEQVDQIKKDLSELKTSVGDYVKSIAYDAATGTLTATKGDGQSVSIKIQQNLPVYTVEIVGNKVVLKADGKEVSNATLPTTPAAFDPAKLTIVDGVIFYDGTKTGATLPKASGSITEIKNGETLIGYTIVVNGQTATFSVIDAVPLKGMIFEPQAYLNGIAAMKAANLQYNKWTALSYEKPSLVGETWKTDGAAGYITPKVVAYYNLNPSSATKNQIKSASFKFDDKEFIGTRAAAFKPTVEKLEDVTVGGQPMLKVTLNVAAELIQAIDAAKVSVLALQATINEDGKGNKVITSDYAAIYKSIITDLRLACNVNDHMHLYGATDEDAKLGQAVEAITKLPTYEVIIGGTPLDLKKVVETHYSEWTDAASRKVLVTDGTLNNIADLGLSYKFSQSNYITGDNATPQNEFFTLVDGVVTPKVYGTEGNAAAGRMPLVRVELIDNATGNTVNAGWIKIEIKKEGVGTLTKDCIFPNFELACGNKENQVSVEFMNVEIYNALGLSKKEFHELYTLKKTSKGEAVLKTGEKGVVVEKVDADPLNETNVVVWTLNQETEVYPSTSNEFTATITYEPKDASTRKDVIITLKTKVTRPSGSISDANKIQEYWDVTKTFVRLNVETPKTGAHCNFVTDLDNAFVGNTIVVSNVPEQYKSFAADKLDYKYIFAAKNAGREVLGNDGKKYTLSVSDNGFTLYAGNTNIVATIDNTTHEVTYNENSPVAKALLNIEAHDANPFFAYINAVVTNQCDMKLPLTNEIFEAKFLRPVNVFKNKDGKFTDAQDGGSTVKLLDLVYLTDWRDAKFSENKSYYTYYNIQSIKMDPNKKVTSSLNGDNFKTPLDQITNQITLVADYKTDQATPDYGTITYHNNGNAVGAFQLKIPVVVTYKWGTVTTDIIVDVEKTIGN